MNALTLNRRQFMQLGATAGAIGVMHGSQAGAFPMVANAGHLGLDADPFLQLAIGHGFCDHDDQAWPFGMRMVVYGTRSQSEAWAQRFGPGVQVQTRFDLGDQSWATLSLNQEALLRGHEWGFNTLFTDHVWGAPWARSANAASKFMTAVANRSPHTMMGQETRWGDAVKGQRQRWLVIDHGFPLRYLQEVGCAYHHRSSHANNRAEYLSASSSHGAQVLSLLLQHSNATSSQARCPLMLYELPDALLQSMPRGALWPDIIDAVVWGVEHTEPGQELLVLLSVVSTDGDRAGNSFITQSASALVRYALARQVRLKWIMAAGNHHASRQNISFELEPGQEAVWQWHLPAQNTQPSFLECWHQAGRRPPRWMVQPPGGPWMDDTQALSWAQRTDPRNGTTQTVFRLAPTASMKSISTLARAGTWRMKWEADQRPMRLDAHLSMMTGPVVGMNRQATIGADDSSTGSELDSVTLSGLVPHMPDVWVAQVLKPGHADPWVVAPHHSELDRYSGRCPLTHDLQGVQQVGVLLTQVHQPPGVHVWSRRGHSIQRATGTSMAVPLMVGQGRLDSFI